MTQREAIPISPDEKDTTSGANMGTMEQDLRRRLAAFPRDANSWYLLGKHLSSRGRHEEAEMALRKAISLNPKPSHFWSELERVLMDLGASAGTESPSDGFDDVSPCISCPEYTYYGCSRGQQCDVLLRWRTVMAKLVQ
ncbi:MAG: tetratricopeptide repeat protein [Candidatus Thorarchaeota archaeon]|nr:tetratricopeptide repeat protein [Candidatus Thorarchaeota archaeon]